MTKNNYPEVLDELAIAMESKLYRPGEFGGMFLDSPLYARALLDVLAERGYVLVDAKKQEPVAYIAGYYKDVINGETDATPLGAEVSFVNMNWRDQIPLYTNPAIPWRVALPDGWKVIGEVIGCFDAAFAEGLQEALAETQDERLKDLVERRLMYALYAAQEADMQVQSMKKEKSNETF